MRLTMLAIHQLGRMAVAFLWAEANRMGADPDNSLALFSAARLQVIMKQHWANPNRLAIALR